MSDGSVFALGILAGAAGFFVVGIAFCWVCKTLDDCKSLEREVSDLECERDRYKAAIDKAREAFDEAEDGDE